MPEAQFRGQLTIAPPDSRRAIDRVRAARNFPAREPEAHERYRWRRLANRRTFGLEGSLMIGEIGLRVPQNLEDGATIVGAET